MLKDYWKLPKIILFSKIFIKIVVSVGDPLISCGNRKIERF